MAQHNGQHQADADFTSGAWAALVSASALYSSFSSLVRQGRPRLPQVLLHLGLLLQQGFNDGPAPVRPNIVSDWHLHMTG